MQDNAFVELWTAVLKQARQYYVRGPSERELEDYRRVAEEDARAWIDSDSEETGSFVWVCDLLGLEPDDVRRRMRRERVGQ